MSDGGPYGQDPDPTEVFPPLPGEPTGPPSTGLPPIGAERDPDPTRVMTPPPSDIPITATPLTGGPYDPGPPYGGDPGGPGGGGPGGPGGPGGEPPFDPEPDPWYRQPGPLAALIAGVAALLVALIALLVWASGDDDNNSDETLPTVVATTSTTTTSTVPASTASTTTTEPTTTSSTTTTSTSPTTTTTSTSPTTTTTVPETTTTAPQTTTTLPATTTTAATTTTIPPTTPVPPGQGLLDEIRSDPDLSTFASALSCTGLDQDVLDGAIRTLLAPTDAVFDAAGLSDPCGTDDGQTFEPVLQLHLVSVDLDAQQVFGADQLQTLGGRVPVNRTSQTIGSNDASIDQSTKAGDGYVHTVDAIIQQ